MRTEKEMRAKITADDRDFKKKTEGAKKQGKSFGQTMVGVAKMIGAAFVLKKAYDGIKRLIGGMMEMADRLLDLSDMTGMSTDALQEYQYVAKIAGVNSEAVSNAALQLTRRFQNLHSEASPISRAFRELGVEAKDVNGNLRSTDSIISDLLPRLADMDNAAERNALGAQMFGGAWQDLAPILAMGADGIEKVKQEARDMGVVMDKDAIAKADELRQAKVRLQESSAALGREIGSALIPVLIRLSEVTMDAVQSMRTFRDGMRAVTKSDDLKWWQKIGVYLGVTQGNAKSLATMFHEMVKEEERAAEAAEELSEQTSHLTQQMERQGPVLNRNIGLFTDYNVILEESDDLLSYLIDTTLELGEATERSMEKMDHWAVIMRNNYKILADAAHHFGNEVMWASVQGASGLKEYSKIVAQTAKSNIAAFLAESVAATIRAHVGLGPAGVVLAGLAAGAVAAMFNTLVPSFAQGGAVSGPTLALVGEAPGISRSNPEYIGTAAQLSQMGGGGTLTARISRNDLLFILNEGERGNRRNF